MKYFHTIIPISDERRENRKNEIDAYINDIKKQLFSLYCEKGIAGQQSGGLCRKEFQIQLQSLPLRNH